MDAGAVRILLVGGREADAASIRRAFERSGRRLELTEADSLREARAMLDGSPPDLVIAELLAPDGKGTELLPTDPDDADFPLIVLAARGDEEEAIDALKAGAVDYVIRTEAALAEMPRTVDRALRAWSHVTARQMADEALRNAYDLLESTFAALDDAVFAIESSGRKIVTCNPAAQRIFGYRMEEMIGRRSEFLYPDLASYEEQGQHARAALTCGEVGHSEFRLRRRDGSTFLAEVTIVPIAGAAGQTPDAVAVVRDLTDRNRATEELGRERDRAQSYLDLVETVIVALDRDGRITLLNRRGCEVLGCCGQDVLGADWFARFIPERERGRVSAVFDKHMAGQIEVGEYFENPVVGAGGAERLMAWHNTLLRDEHGEVTGVLGSGTDITDHRRAESELSRAEARYRTLVEQLPAVTYVAALDDEATTLYVSPQIERYLGYSPAEYAEDPDIWRKALYPDDRERVLGEYHRAYAAGSSFASEYRMIARDGRVVWFRDEAVLVEDPQGKPLFYQGIMLDITERQQLEEQLRQSQKMEAIGVLAGGIAHDFRNQLAVIQGYGEMLLRRSMVTEEGQERVGEILKAAERSATLSSQLLTFSRRQMLRPRTVDLNEVIAEMSKSLGRLIGEDIRLIIVPGANLGSVNVDPGLFQQAVMNLVTNARDAMPAGGELTIETANIALDDRFVRAHLDSRAGPHVRVTVGDTGSGMDSATLQRIFEPFFTTKPVGEGTGLGLPMVYGFVKQSEGYVDVQSDPGKGTEFLIYLPRAAEPAERAAPPAPEPLPRGHETVLVVEDENAIRRVIVETLRECGYTVLESAGAKEALPLGTHYEDHIDLLIADVVMPGMTGVDLAGRIAAIRPDIRILYVSGYTGRSLTNRGITDSQAELLVKPFTSTALTRTVRRVLDAGDGRS